MCEREARELPWELNVMMLRRLANMLAGEVLLMIAHKEGKFTATRLRPASRLDQKIEAVSSTV